MHDWTVMVPRTVRYTDIPKISVLNQYRYIDTGYSTILIYQNFSVFLEFPLHEILH